MFPGTRHYVILSLSFSFFFFIFFGIYLFVECRVQNRLCAGVKRVCMCSDSWVRAHFVCHDKNDINIDIKTVLRNINKIVITICLCDASSHARALTIAWNTGSLQWTVGTIYFISRLISVGLNSVAIFLILLCISLVCVHVFSVSFEKKVSLYALSWATGCTKGEHNVYLLCFRYSGLSKQALNRDFVWWANDEMHSCTHLSLPAIKSVTHTIEGRREMEVKHCPFTTISLSLCQSVFTIIKINFVVTSSSDLFLCMWITTCTYLFFVFVFIFPKMAKEEEEEEGSILRRSCQTI